MFTVASVFIIRHMKPQWWSLIINQASWIIMNHHESSSSSSSSSSPSSSSTLNNHDNDNQIFILQELAGVLDLESVGPLCLAEAGAVKAPYQERSKRWSDDLGFQGSNPWSDFRGGGGSTGGGGLLGKLRSWSTSTAFWLPSRPTIFTLPAVSGGKVQSEGVNGGCGWHGSKVCTFAKILAYVSEGLFTNCNQL